jgi:CubicO group peptidase (beta-lactamase class C family)
MDFSALKDYLERLPEEWGIPQCTLIVRQGRETIFEDSVGPDRGDVYWLYSATKLFTAVMFCRLLEQGRLKLEDKVSDYLPEYANLEIDDGEGKRRTAQKPLLLEHLITMCGGLTYDIFHPLITGAKDRSTRGIVREIAKMPLVDEPGDTYLYSLCHDVLAAVMETVTGIRYQELLRREIIEPLGMKNTCFHPDARIMKRFAPQFEWQGRKKGAIPCEGTNKFCFSPEYDSGGAGLCSSAEDYILLPEALANGGRGRDGYPVLKPETIEAMRTDHIHGSRRPGFNLRWERFRSYGYGLGVRTRIDSLDGGKSPVGEFGWDGAAGAYCIIDPENRVSAFYVQHVLNMGPVFEEIHPKLRDLVYEGLE